MVLKRIWNLFLTLSMLFASSCIELKKNSQEDYMKKLGVPLPIENKAEYLFDTFKIRMEKTVRHVEEGGPASTPITQHFIVSPESDEPFEIFVTIHQLPPEPVNFKVGKDTFTLTTHTLPDGKIIEHNYFAVFKKR